MPKMPAQFTAAQVLQAARRAEAEGKMDYAVQFYRHLVDSYAQAPEAHDAREGLRRIADWRWGEGRGAARQSPGGGHRAASPAPAVATAATGAVRPAYSQEPVYRPPVAAEPMRTHKVPQANEDLPTIEIAGHYRAGRILARIVASIGGAVMLFGAAFALYSAWASTPPQWEQGAFGIPDGIMIGLAGAVIGLIMLFAGQAAVAVFDNADATHALLDHERAKAEL